MEKAQAEVRQAFRGKRKIEEADIQKLSSVKHIRSFRTATEELVRNLFCFERKDFAKPKPNTIMELGYTKKPINGPKPQEPRVGV